MVQIHEARRRSHGSRCRMNSNSAYLIAQELSESCAMYTTEAFLSYVSSIYGLQIHVLPQFDWFLIAHCEEGDIRTNRLTFVYSRLWKTDPSGLIVCNAKSISHDAEGNFDKTPIIRFYYQGDDILIKERLGPRIMCYKKGKLIFHEDKVLIRDLRVLWVN